MSDSFLKSCYDDSLFQLTEEIDRRAEEEEQRIRELSKDDGVLDEEIVLDFE